MINHMISAVNIKIKQISIFAMLIIFTASALLVPFSQAQGQGMPAVVTTPAQTDISSNAPGNSGTHSNNEPNLPDAANAEKPAPQPEGKPESTITPPAAPEADLPQDPKDREKPDKKVDTSAALRSELPGSPSAKLENGNSKRLTPEVDNQSGALTYSYDIVVPPGRNGMQPGVSLSYNSNNANSESIVGAGWDLSIPSIQRVNLKGSNSLYAENYFVSSLDGELVSLGSGNFAAKNENGSFSTYSLASNVWTVKDKTGTVYKFGNSAGSRQDNPSDSSKIFKWMLEEVRDTNDNYIKYEYFKDAGQIYPSKITYTGNGSTDGIFEVEIYRQARSDVSVSNSTGFTVTTSYRINQIKTEVSNVMARTYDLSFATGINGVRSVLSSIIESGRDESGNIISLPATEFDYTIPSGVGWTAPSSWNIPTNVSFRSNGYMQSAIVDVNGDGHADVMQDTAAVGKWVYLNKGDGTGWDNSSSAWSMPTNFNLRNGWGQIADINGDSLPDLMSEVAGESKYVFLNNGTNGWTDVTSTFSVPSWVNFFSNGSQATSVTDINGDGLADIISEEVISDVAIKKVFLNNGDNTGWTESTAWTLPSVFSLRSSGYTGNIVGDVNGDNLPDLMYEDVSGTPLKKLYLNNGKDGWVENTSLVIPTPVRFVTGGYTAISLVDFNGDGWNDFISHTQDDGIDLYINDADNTGWTVNTNWTFPAGFDLRSIDTMGSMISDIDGDGMVDLMQEKIVNDVPVKTKFLNNGDKSDLLSVITYPSGGYSDIVYKQSPLYLNGTTLLNPKLPLVLTTLYSITNNDGLGTAQTTTYKYENGEYFYGSPTDRKFAGFNKVTSTNAVGNKTVSYFHQGNTIDSSNGEFDDHSSKIGKLYRTEVRDSTNNLFALSVNKWDKYDLGSGRNFVKNIRTTSLTYDGDADHKDKAEEYTYDNTYGNLTSKTEWGEVTAANDGSFTDTGTDKFTTTVSYAANIGAYIVGLPSQDTRVDQSSNKVAENKYYYDLQALGSVTDGNLTKQEMWKTGSTYIDIEKTYNTTYGLVTQEKDPRDKATNYTYDSYNLYPATVTNALSQATSFTYDYSSGQVKQTTDPNTRVFQNVYDGLDRVLEEKQPDLTTPATLVTKALYVYTDTSGAVKVKKTDYLDSSTSVDSYSYFDGLNRPIQSRTEMEDVNTFAVTDTIYNSNGEVYKQSLPYSSTGSSKTAATATTALLITNTYDAMSRVTNIANVIGSTSNSYDDWKLTITDPRGKLKDLYNDAFGNLVRVDEHNGASTYTTTYNYNGNNNLTKITDSLSNIRNFTYDGLGRQLTAQDLHAPSDVTFGTWTYAYDDAGNRTQVIDPKSQTVNYTYDDLSRALTEDYTGQAGTETTYAYDSGTDGIGRLTSVTNSGANSAYVYNALGGLKQETKTINAIGYITSYTYDRLGNQLEITNPDSSKVKYAYNTAGQLETIQRKESTDGAFINVVTDYDYGPHGKVIYQVDNNGITTTNTYDAAKMYRLSRKETNNPSGGGGSPTTVSFYASSGDGSAFAGSTVWDTAHDATTGDVADYTATSININTGKYNTNAYKVQRGFIPFDTSSLPDNATITDAKLKVYVNSKLNNDNDGDDWVTVVQGSQPSTTALTTADFDLAGSINTPTEGIDVAQRKDITSVTTGQYLTYTLNSTGRGWVSLTGATKLAMREGHDVIDSAFTGSNNQNNQLFLRSSEYTGTSSDPILEVIYTTGSSPSVIQDLNYTYDANGNITKVIDASNTNSSKTVDYTYDDLNRLLSATASSVAAGQSTYTHSYTYDAIGNILTRTDAAGTYSYAGSSGGSYANPHAVTSVGSTNYTYDNNGNMLTETGGLNNTWDYGNRITQVVKGGVTSTYGYDHGGQRVKLASGSSTTYYPSAFYNTDGVAAQKHIMTPGGEVVATVKGTGGSAAVYYSHSDQLGSSSAVTNGTGGLEELMDYFPYGNIRLDQKAGSFSEQRKYTGHEYDVDTGLSYMEARYYNPSIGRFLSQDPVFLALGNAEQVKSITGSELQNVLSDPQGLNSYAYARNNPLKFVDPDGQFFREKWEEAKEQANKGVVWVGNKAEQAYQNNSVARYALDHPYVAGAAIGVAGGALVAGGVVAGGGAITCGVLCGGAAATVAGTAAPVAQQVQKNQQQIFAAGNRTLNLTQHALARMTERGITQQQVSTIAQKGQAFDYIHEGVSKIGYYDSASKVLIATVRSTGNITTVISNVSQSYVNGLIQTVKK